MPRRALLLCCSAIAETMFLSVRYFLGHFSVDGSQPCRMSDLEAVAVGSWTASVSKMMARSSLVLRRRRARTSTPSRGCLAWASLQKRSKKSAALNSARASSDDWCGGAGGAGGHHVAVAGQSCGCSSAQWDVPGLSELSMRLEGAVDLGRQCGWKGR